MDVILDMPQENVRIMDKSDSAKLDGTGETGVCRLDMGPLETAVLIEHAKDGEY